MSKRKRDPVFHRSEKLLLVDLVEKHYNIIESKKTDAVSVREKNDEWRKISINFNATSGLYNRDWTVIKNCWENLKKKAKGLITQANQATGGGPPKSFFKDPVIERVINLIKPTVTGFTNEFNTDETLVLANEGHESPEIKIELDCSHYTPATLKSPTQSSLRSKNICLRQSEDQLLVSNSNNENIEPILLSSGNNMQSSYEATPVRFKVQSVSHRRPVLKQSQTLTQQIVDLLLSASQQAKEQHEAQMRILQLQEEREIEMLQQERLRTEQEQLRILILKEELKKLQ